MQSCLHDCGQQELKILLHSDASAALGVVERKGAGRLRHIDTNVLWIQEKEVKKHIAFKKVNGKRNPADLCTKNVLKAMMNEHMAKLNIKVRQGRPAVAAQAH